MNAFPEIETYTRIYRPGNVVVRYEVENQPPAYFTETKLLAVDSNFLDVFTFAFVSGDKTPLSGKAEFNRPYIESTAKKYFGDQPAIGKTLLLGNGRKPATVTAVLK